MRFRELSGDQRRQFIDAKQAFEAWRGAAREFRHSFRSTMHWRASKGIEYLARRHGSIVEYVGPRSPETERIMEDYNAARAKQRARLMKLESRLEEMRLVNRAMGLGRVPQIAARVLRKLDERELLGRHVFVAGTHALYAYEARTGILFGGELMATTDIDFLWDARQRFTFLMQDINERGVMALLRQVDATFKRTHRFRAENEDPYLVEFIRAERRDEAMKPNLKITAADGDLEPAPIEGLNWLINAPKFEEVVMGMDGRPALLSCIDPRAFALHKLWLSKRSNRDGLKRRRDELQARAVAAVATQLMGLKFDRRNLTALPKELADGAQELAKATLDL